MLGSKNISKQNIFLIVCCAIAVCRIVFFASISPFFATTDEQYHLDMIYKHTQKLLPLKDALYFDDGSCRIIGENQTWEYLNKKEFFKNGITPKPNWLYRISGKNDIGDYVLKWKAEKWQGVKNTQYASAPVYYIAAALWYRIGKNFIIYSGILLYWMRFFNAFVYIGIILISYRLLRYLFDDDHSFIAPIILLVSFFPQNVFYSINSDIFSPLFAVVCLYMSTKLFCEKQGYRYYFFTGTALALAVLVKLTNIPLVAVCFAVVGMKLVYSSEKHKYKKVFCLGGAFFITCLPWVVGNQLLFGDLTGTREKIAILGWTRNTVNEIIRHPIFTFKGAYYFVTELIKKFWRGELAWHREELCSRPMDIFYLISSLVFISVGCFQVRSYLTEKNIKRVYVVGVSALLVGTSVMFLAVLSTMYNFNECIYPSKEFPYFVSGRLIAGVLIPFLTLYVIGMRTIFGKKNVLYVTAALCIAMFVSEVLIFSDIFHSEYNLISMLTRFDEVSALRF